jgi:hypothetical protein
LSFDKDGYILPVKLTNKGVSAQVINYVEVAGNK